MGITFKKIFNATKKAVKVNSKDQVYLDTNSLGRSACNDISEDLFGKQKKRRKKSTGKTTINIKL